MDKPKKEKKASKKHEPKTTGKVALGIMLGTIGQRTRQNKAKK